MVDMLCSIIAYFVVAFCAGFISALVMMDRWTGTIPSDSSTSSSTSVVYGGTAQSRHKNK